MMTTRLHDTSDPAQGIFFEALKRGEPLVFFDSNGDHGVEPNYTQSASELLSPQEEPAFVLLHTLGSEHQFRMEPLGKLNAQCRNLRGKEWRDVARWAIAATCYNSLGDAWTSTSEFRVCSDVAVYRHGIQ